MRRWTVRIVGLAIALGITLAVFLFYGQFAEAMKHALEAPVVQPGSDPNEVTVTIIPGPKPKCPKDKPCPP